jgi:hypothetical protein
MILMVLRALIDGTQLNLPLLTDVELGKQLSVRFFFIFYFLSSVLFSFLKSN